MDDPPGPRRFLTTRWSLVAAAGPGHAREALEELCRTYWYPLYAYVRSRGHTPDEAQDLTQAFFAMLLESGGIDSADREKGRFRSYLLGAMKHFLTSSWRHDQALKRGGAVRILELDALDPEARFAAGSSPEPGPEKRFDLEWARTVTGQALHALQIEMEQAGKGVQFQALKGSLTGETSLDRPALAARLGMSEGGLKVAVHRLRQRYRRLIRDAVAETVGDEADLEEEMRYLVAVLREN